MSSHETTLLQELSAVSTQEPPASLQGTMRALNAGVALRPLSA